MQCTQERCWALLSVLKIRSERYSTQTCIGQALCCCCTVRNANRHVRANEQTYIKKKNFLVGLLAHSGYLHVPRNFYGAPDDDDDDPTLSGIPTVAAYNPHNGPSGTNVPLASDPSAQVTTSIASFQNENTATTLTPTPVQLSTLRATAMFVVGGTAGFNNVFGIATAAQAPANPSTIPNRRIFGTERPSRPSRARRHNPMPPPMSLLVDTRSPFGCLKTRLRCSAVSWALTDTALPSQIIGYKLTTVWALQFSCTLSSSPTDGNTTLRHPAGRGGTSTPPSIRGGCSPTAIPHPMPEHRTCGQRRGFASWYFAC